MTQHGHELDDALDAELCYDKTPQTRT